MCRSIKTAEAVSAEENSGRGANFGKIVRELLTGKKQHEQIPKGSKEDILAETEMFIDNESTYYNIHSDKNPIEHTLIYDIRRIQQLLKERSISKVHLVDTKAMLADIFTKEMKPNDLFSRAFYNGLLVPNCRCCYSRANALCSSGYVELEPGFETGAESQLSAEEEESQ